jgi:hypothetical protein
VAVPARTPEQRREASVRAVAARRRRAEVSAALKRGDLTVRDLLDLADGEDAVAAMHVSAVLQSLPRMGPRRGEQALTRLRISPSRRLRGLGSDQRRALLETDWSSPSTPGGPAA